MTTYIYTLADPRDGFVRYVGKTTNLNERYRCHVNPAKSINDHRTNWLRSLRKSGLTPVMEVLEEIHSDDDSAWRDAERFWIESLRCLGCKLVNTQNGRRARQREINLQQGPEFWEHVRTLHRFHTPEVRARIAMKRRGQRHSMASRRKMSQSRQFISPETRRRLRDSHKGQRPTPEQKARWWSVKSEWIAKHNAELDAKFRDCVAIGIRRTMSIVKATGWHRNVVRRVANRGIRNGWLVSIRRGAYAIKELQT